MALIVVILIVKAVKTPSRDVMGVELKCKNCGSKTNGLKCPKCEDKSQSCLLYTSPSPRDLSTSRMPSSA